MSFGLSYRDFEKWMVREILWTEVRPVHDKSRNIFETPNIAARHESLNAQKNSTFGVQI